MGYRVSVATPIVLPALDAFGIDRVHFGIILVLAAMAPFMVPIFLVLSAIRFFPELALWLPSRVLID